MSKQRLDVLLVSRNLVESRELAQRLIIAGEVSVGGHPSTKPGLKISEDAEIAIRNRPRYVSRGGLKMEGALNAFPVSAEGKVCLDIGASTGGTDIVAMILNKYTSMPVGRALMVSDVGIVLVGAYLYGPATGLYCILGMILKSTVADSAIESINMRKVCTIVTSNPTPVRDFIVNDLHRSATMEQAEGAYTHDEKWVLTTVLTRGQAQKLRLYVRGLDDHAFITIVNSSEIVGKGFRAI